MNDKPICQTTIAILALIPSLALAQSSLPNPMLTPGAINPEVTQETIGNTICVRGWTRAVRPPRAYASHIKHELVRAYGYTGRMRDFELDHLIPLDLGGAPADPRNLWPEPRWPADGWTADMKDDLEAALVRKVCAGDLLLHDAQEAIRSNWEAAWTQFMRWW